MRGPSHVCEMEDTLAAMRQVHTMILYRPSDSFFKGGVTKAPSSSLQLVTSSNPSDRCSLKRDGATLA